jgi:hypothetical protein
MARLRSFQRIVGEAQDIVFSQAVPGLRLDDFKGNSVTRMAVARALSSRMKWSEGRVKGTTSWSLAARKKAFVKQVIRSASGLRRAAILLYPAKEESNIR